MGKRYAMLQQRHSRSLFHADPCTSQVLCAAGLGVGGGRQPHHRLQVSPAARTAVMGNHSQFLTASLPCTYSQLQQRLQGQLLALLDSQPAVGRRAAACWVPPLPWRAPGPQVGCLLAHSHNHPASPIPQSRQAPRVRCGRGRLPGHPAGQHVRNPRHLQARPSGAGPGGRRRPVRRVHGVGRRQRRRRAWGLAAAQRRGVPSVPRAVLGVRGAGCVPPPLTHFPPVFALA